MTESSPPRWPGRVWDFPDPAKIDLDAADHLPELHKNVLARLRSYIWKYGWLPSANRDLAIIASVSSRDWSRKFRPLMRDLFYVTPDKRWHDPALERARSRAIDISMSRGKAAQQSNLAKLSANDTAKADANGSTNPDANDRSEPSAEEVFDCLIENKINQTNTQRVVVEDTPRASGRKVERKPECKPGHKSGRTSDSKTSVPGPTDEEIKEGIRHAARRDGKSHLAPGAVTDRTLSIVRRWVVVDEFSFDQDYLAAVAHVAKSFGDRITNPVSKQIKNTMTDMRHERLMTAGGQNAAPPADLGQWVEKDTPEWEAWCHHKRKKSMHSFSSTLNGMTEGNYFPTRWPPGHDAYRIAAE